MIALLECLLYHGVTIISNKLLAYTTYFLVPSLKFNCIHAIFTIGKWQYCIPAIISVPVATFALLCLTN